MPTQPTRKSPRILLRKGDRPLIVLDAQASKLVAEASPTAASLAATASTFKALGYRQTMLAAAKGGKLLNANGWRFRNGAMRALGRSFRGKSFVSGHDWSDARARGGTIVDAYAEEMENDSEFGMFFDVLAQSSWAIEGLANGTIDRFSMGAVSTGEIMCTVHDAPVFTECWCCPGETVTMEVVEGDVRKLVDVVAEWEHESGEGAELSAVNVPAVDGTGIVQAAAIAGEILADRAAEMTALAELCGRQPPARRTTVAMPGAQEGGSPRVGAPITMAVFDEQPRGDQMDRALICQQLGLPPTATDDEIKAKLAAISADAAQAGVLRAQLNETATREKQLAAERDASHVESEITRLRASRQVGDEVVSQLRETAKQSRAAFDATLKLVEAAAAPIVTATTRTDLQSDKKAAANPGGGPIEFDADGGPDALELNRSNPHLGKIMKTCQVTAADVRKHGSRTFNTLPNLRELADNTAARGDRFGVGK